MDYRTTTRTRTHNARLDKPYGVGGRSRMCLYKYLALYQALQTTLPRNPCSLPQPPTTISRKPHRRRRVVQYRATISTKTAAGEVSIKPLLLHYTRLRLTEPLHMLKHLRSLFDFSNICFCDIIKKLNIYFSIFFKRTGFNISYTSKSVA